MPGLALAPGVLTTRPTSAAAGGDITISTRAASANGARTPSPRGRRASTLSTPPRSNTSYVNNPTGDGMVTKFANGVQMILQRDGWHGSCGMKFEGTEGWVTIADDYEKPEVSSPSLLSRFRQAHRRVHANAPSGR